MCEVEGTRGGDGTAEALMGREEVVPVGGHWMIKW